MEYHENLSRYNSIVAKILLTLSTILLFVSIPVAFEVFNKGELYNRQVEGTVFDQSTGSPLGGVKILLEKDAKKLTSSEDGEFNGIVTCLNYCESDKIFITKEGYKPQMFNVGKSQKHIVLNIPLERLNK